MRFNPQAFQQQSTPAPEPAASGDSIAATSVDALPTNPAIQQSIHPAVTAFIAAYGRPGANKVTVPPHHLAVTLCLKFNDSAPQVDHFDHHAHLGCPEFLVMLVKKQNGKPGFSQTENLARRALSLCPELQSLDWKWHSERYAGGHGNYLASSSLALPLSIVEVLDVRRTWGSQPVTEAFWEIEFQTPIARSRFDRGDALQLWPHKNFGKQPAAGLVEPSTNLGPVTAAWALNERFGGVEIHFSRRPDDAALNPLRAWCEAGVRWRYTGKTRCWYTQQTPETIAFAKAFCEKFNYPQPEAPVRPERKFIRFVPANTI